MEPLTPDEVEILCASLRTYASVCHDFYRALVDQGFPADGATAVVTTWLAFELEAE